MKPKPSSIDEGAGKAGCHITVYYGDSAFNLLALSARQRSNVFQLNALSP